MKFSWPLKRNRTATIQREIPAVPLGSPSRNGAGEAENAVPDEFWRIDEAEVIQLSENTFYQMSVDVFFNARHYVSFQGNPGPEHAHSYRLQATCRTQGLAREDHMVIGFQFLRQTMIQVVNAYNNRLLNRLPPFKNIQPTTEVLAAILFRQLDRLLIDLGLVLISITVWESPTEAITYGRNSDATG